MQADAQSAEDAGAPSGESLGYYWGLPKDKKNKDGQATEASLQHLQKLSEEKAKSSAGQSGFYFSHVRAGKLLMLGALCPACTLLLCGHAFLGRFQPALLHAITGLFVGR